ncbi:metallophosphoesterase family protein [Nocardioides rubriscoriae]|uniref:metallophosphoesterase family protein n=1 Tax=Nocardioides rubriscoriae TaxID=642762 RepID=UPI00147949E2|nr:metallophosphoesterase [Nocardioides rubriscoriae]
MSTTAHRCLGALLAVALATVPTACSGRPFAAQAQEASAGGRAAPTVAVWTDGVAVTAGGSLVTGRVTTDQGTRRVRVELRNAYPVAIPDPCEQSTVKNLHSYLDGRTLVCELDGDTTALTFTAIVDGGVASRVGGSVTTRTDSATSTGSLPERVVTSASDLTPDTRLLSSPDFLNADVGDLSRGPNRWDPSRSTNGTNASYDAALGLVLDDWAALDPAAVLVAGDLVNGRWGADDQDTGTFGPVGTLADKRAAVRSAARTYYPQWQQRFDDHGLAVFPSIGDHELGDNPFGPGKRDLAATFRSEFARQFTTDADGTPRYGERPPGPARGTAWAARPSPDVQVVSLDVFDVTRDGVRIRLDPQQLRWLTQVLAKAQRDQVTWTIVESHVPIVFPVRHRASSALHYEGGTRSALWKVLRRYDVDLYLSGEVHDTQLVARDDIVQVSHGGAFQFGLTTALVLDFYGDNLYLTLRDYDIRRRDVGERLWETRRSGLYGELTTQRAPLVIGTASLHDDGVVDTSGILTPVDSRVD